MHLNVIVSIVLRVASNMKKQIIVTLNRAGVLVSFADTECFVLWEKRQAHWHPADEWEYRLGHADAAAIREAVSALASRFEDCRIIVSRKVLGIPYQMLNKTGFSIFEADTVSDRLLDDIAKDVSESRAIADQPPAEPLSPHNDGHYYFDLVRLQKAYPEISSKRALMGFMSGADFVSLELICDHLPPWMEDVMNARGLQYRHSKEADGSSRYVIAAR